jgi:hypothetical protein|nr:hypothetical protein [Enterocloster clostridioformis]
MVTQYREAVVRMYFYIQYSFPVLSVFPVKECIREFQTGDFSCRNIQQAA